MLNYTNNGITVSSYLDTRRQNKDGTFPIKIKVAYKRERQYYNTGKTIALAEWEKLAETRVKVFQELKTDLQYTFDRVVDVVKNLERNELFSLKSLNERLGKGGSHSINLAFKVKCDALNENNQINTHNYYNDTLNAIEKFAGTNIPFNEITVDWLKLFEKHLLDEGKSFTTIGMRMIALRTMVNQARKDGFIKEAQYPFGRDKYEIPTGQGRKLALSLHQIKQIITFSDGTDTTEKFRDLWFFSYLCNGMNFADILTLKYSNIKNGEIYFIRGKTINTSRVKKELYAIITPEVNQIINKWGNKDKSPDNYIFPFLKGGETPLEIKKRTRDVISNCNRRLKKIGKKLGIDGLSTYAARHSYATVLKRSGTNIAYISESLGHSSLKTTENYLASFEREEREKNAKLLTDFGE